VVRWLYVRVLPTKAVVSVSEIGVKENRDDSHPRNASQNNTRTTHVNENIR
jgi:hypothetical protein